MKWESKKERAREREIETLSCWGEVERPLPWMPTSASMSEFSDSVIDSCSTWEHRNTKLLDSLLPNFEGLGETKVEREHDDESNPILLFTFTTLRVRAIVVTCYIEKERERVMFFCLLCVWMAPRSNWIRGKTGRNTKDIVCPTFNLQHPQITPFCFTPLIHHTIYHTFLLLVVFHWDWN
jgi:hypothetical protein